MMCFLSLPEKSFGVKTAIIVADFAEESGEAICERVLDVIKDKEVGLLVNNVGTMQKGPQFLDEVKKP